MAPFRWSFRYLYVLLAVWLISWFLYVILSPSECPSPPHLPTFDDLTTDPDGPTFRDVCRHQPCTCARPPEALSPPEDYVGESHPIRRHLRACVFILGTAVSQERYQDMSFETEDARIEYIVRYVYASNDNYGEDSLVLDGPVVYGQMVRKLWFGFNYYRHKSCDWILKIDDDTQVDLVLLSYFLIRGNANSWMGRWRVDTPVDLHPTSIHFDQAYIDFTGLSHYLQFTNGPLHIIGSNLFTCMLKTGDKIVSRGFLDLPTDDAALGILAAPCDIEPRDLTDLSFGERVREHGAETKDVLGVLSFHKAWKMLPGDNRKKLIDFAWERFGVVEYWWPPDGSEYGPQSNLE